MSVARDVLPPTARRTAGWCVLALLVAAVGWLVLGLLGRVRLVAVSAAVALLLAAALDPLRQRLLRLGSPRWLAAMIGVLVLLAVPAGFGLLVWSRASSRLPELQGTLTAGVDRIRDLLVSEPLSLSPTQVGTVRDAVVGWLTGLVPGPAAGAAMALEATSGVLIAGFTLFFLLKDGHRLWWWVVAASPARHRSRVAACGAAAWSTLSSYAGGVLLVATVDAASIGLTLVLLGVPLALPLTVLVFLGAFVPLIGATVAGVAAVLVTLVTEGTTPALVVLAVVLVVEQVEGNLLYPLIVGRAVELHPVVILLAVSGAALVGGIAAAAVAVPLLAAGTAIGRVLRTSIIAAG